MEGTLMSSSDKILAALKGVLYCASFILIALIMVSSINIQKDVNSTKEIDAQEVDSNIRDAH